MALGVGRSKNLEPTTREIVRAGRRATREPTPGPRKMTGEHQYPIREIRSQTVRLDRGFSDDLRELVVALGKRAIFAQRREPRITLIPNRLACQF